MPLRKVFAETVTFKRLKPSSVENSAVPTAATPDNDTIQVAIASQLALHACHHR